MKDRPDNTTVIAVTVLVNDPISDVTDAIGDTLRALEDSGRVVGFNFTNTTPASSVVGGPDDTKYATEVSA